jgi:hypothetical protein
VVLLPGCACDGGADWLDGGLDWLVVVVEFPEGVDCVFWADGAELVEEAELGEELVDEEAAGAGALIWLCAAGAELVRAGSLGDCANAPVPSNKPMAVVISKRSLMFRSLELVTT